MCVSALLSLIAPEGGRNRCVAEMLDRASKRRGVRSCAGFRTPATTSYPRAPKAGVRKAPRHEIAGGTLGRPCRVLSYWDLSGERATSSIGSGRREIERLQRCDARCGPAVIGLEPQSDDSGKIGARAKNLSEPGRVQAER